MRFCSTFSNLVFYALLCAASLGCSVAEDPPIPVITPTVEQPIVSPVTDDSDTQQEQDQRADQPSDFESSLEPQPINGEPLAYEPPFPDREDPFLAPHRKANATYNGDENSRDEVQLLGFANVTGQKAILSINGMVVPIGEGGLESGIEVISIQPPAVVLQRNKQRWQTSLEY